MELKNFFAQDTKGNIIPNATCYLYLAGTEALATGLQDGDGAALSNPFTAGANGKIQFSAPNGRYDLRVVSGQRDYRIRVQCVDLDEQVEAVEAIRADIRNHYYGPLPADPSTRPDGSAMAEGDEYQNTATKKRRLFNGSVWEDFVGASTADLANAADSDKGAGMVGWKQSGVGSISRDVGEKLREFVSVKDFGAVGDGIADDTAAFQAAYNYLRFQNPINNRGAGRIFIPRGIYLCNGTINMSSALTVTVYGEGPEATQIVRTIDSGDLFKIGTYSYVEFYNLGIYHAATSDRSAWTTNCFAISGAGGGREFCLRRVRTGNFNRVISFYGAGGNEDTNYIESCTFNDFKTFLYSRNSQAVVNKAVQCTWAGYTDRVFDVYGFGYTHIDTSNIVQSGVFLYIATGASNPTAQFLVTNAKFEFWNGITGKNSLGTTKIIELEDSATCRAHVRFINSGISGGSPDPGTYQWDMLGSAYTLQVTGGQWQNTKIRTKGRTIQGSHNAFWIKFEDAIESPSTTIERTGGGHHPAVVFSDCRGVENILMRGNSGTGSFVSGVARDRNRNTKNGTDGNLASGAETRTHIVLSYGQRTLVEKIRVIVTGKIGWQGAEIRAFADSSKTTQIGTTITTAGGTGTTPEIYDIDVPASTFTSDGVYVDIKNTNSNGVVTGLVYVDTLSV